MTASTRTFLLVMPLSMTNNDSDGSLVVSFKVLLLQNQPKERKEASRKGEERRAEDRGYQKMMEMKLVVMAGAYLCLEIYLKIMTNIKCEIYLKQKFVPSESKKCS